MRLIVDAMNVLHAWHNAPVGGKAMDVAALANAIRASRYGREEVVLVVDGGVPPGADSVDGRYEASGCAVLFSGPGVEADEVIEGILEGPGPVRETVVISADRRLGRAARRRGARSMGSGTFVQVLTEDAAGEGGDAREGTDRPELDSEEVQAWLDEFGVGVEEPRRASPNEGVPPRESRETGGSTGQGADWEREVEREWPGLRPEDLDMDRWLDETGGGAGKPGG